MTDLVIWGTGGLGRQAVQIAEDQNSDRATWNVLGFLDDKVPESSEHGDGSPVLGGEGWLSRHGSVAVFIAIGNPASRFQVRQRLREFGHEAFATLCHPSAWIANRSKVGMGCLVYPFVAIDSDVTIGDHVIINKACTIGHDSTLEDFVTCAPGVNLGGNNLVGEGCDLGIGCSSIQGLRIGAWSIVGAGAVVTQDLPDDVTAVGVPAREIKARTKGWHRSSNRSTRSEEQIEHSSPKSEEHLP